MRVLVIEDDELNAASVVRVLGKTHCCLCVRSIDAAFEVAAGFDPEVILLDVYLEHENAIGEIPRLNTLCPRAGIVVVTGNFKADDGAKVMALGAHSYIGKNVSVEFLRNAVAAAKKR